MYLSNACAIAVRRQMYYSRLENGSYVARPFDYVVVHFRTDRPTPFRTFLGLTSHRVREYFDPAVQCFRFQRHGHYANDCRG